MRNAASGPSAVSCAASASIIVSTGTRWQWPLGVRRFLVDRRVDERDEAAEERLELADQELVRQHDAGEAGQRFREPLIVFAELDDVSAGVRAR